MRAIISIGIGLWMVWVQTLAAVAPHFVEKTLACQCCRCGQAACTTQITVPAPGPSPVTTSDTVSKTEKKSPSVQEATALPAPMTSVLGDSTVSDARRPASIPLFQRHCVLLI